MKRVRAFNKASGAEEGIVHASALDDKSRYFYHYRCLDKACDCTFHWRRAVETSDGERLYPTFVKNPSSVHIPGCAFDYVQKMRSLGAVGEIADDYLYLRIAFPPGGGPDDRGKWSKGALSRYHHRHMRGKAQTHNHVYTHLQDVVRDLETAFTRLDHPALENVYLDYKGRLYNWQDLWVPANSYNRLWQKTGQIDPDRTGDTPAALLVVRPKARIADSQRGNPRYVCAMQPGTTRSGIRDIRPVIAANKDDIQLNSLIESVIAANATLLIAGRPFAPQAGAAPESGQRRNPANVYLYAANGRQAATIHSRYWQRTAAPTGQFTLGF